MILRHLILNAAVKTFVNFLVQFMNIKTQQFGLAVVLIT